MIFEFLAIFGSRNRRAAQKEIISEFAFYFLFFVAQVLRFQVLKTKAKCRLPRNCSELYSINLWTHHIYAWKKNCKVLKESILVESFFSLISVVFFEFPVGPKGGQNETLFNTMELYLPDECGPQIFGGGLSIRII